MRIITWNTQNRTDTRSQAEFLRERRPEVVALQEVTPRSLESWKEELPKVGLPHVMSPVTQPISGNSGVLIASKAPVERLAHADGALDTESRWPKTHASLSLLLAGRVRLHTACLCGELPDRKEVIHSAMRRGRHPTILAGDLHGDESDDPLGLRKFGMRDVYLDLHGHDEAGCSFVAGTRIDHVFASSDLQVRYAKYWTAKMGTIAGGGLSDHAPLEVVLDLVGATATTRTEAQAEDSNVESESRRSRRPIWEADILRRRPTFVSAALGGDGAVRSFARNERGRDFVVGDIHGMYSALERFLHELSFDPGRDRLFSVGDLIDRGPESEAALQWLTGRDWFHAIRGNHDQFLLDAAADPAGERGEEHGFWEYNGGGWWNSVPAPGREAWVRAFSALPFAAEVDCEIGPVGIVHADVPEDRTWEEFLSALREGSRQDCYHAIWSRRRMERYVQGGAAEAAPPVEGRVACVICGHARGERAVRMANLWMIDTGAAYTSMPGSRFTIARIHPGPIELFEHPR